MKPFFGKTQPSEFLQAMVDGLRDADNAPGQEINMQTFGNVNEGVCYGCAATWALQRLMGGRLSDAQVTALGWMDAAHLEPLTWHGESIERIMDFERAIDHARMGCLLQLADFCALPQYQMLSPWANCWYWGVGNHWQTELVLVEAAIREMEAKGL